MTQFMGNFSKAPCHIHQWLQVAEATAIGSKNLAQSTQSLHTQTQANGYVADMAENILQNGDGLLLHLI